MSSGLVERCCCTENQRSQIIFITVFAFSPRVFSVYLVEGARTGDYMSQTILSMFSHLRSGYVVACAMDSVLEIAASNYHEPDLSVFVVAPVFST